MLPVDVRLGLMPSVIAMSQFEVISLDLRGLAGYWNDVMKEGVDWLNFEVGRATGGELAVVAANPELFSLHPKKCDCLYVAVHAVTDRGADSQQPVLTKNVYRLYRFTPALRGFAMDRGRK